jgi:hypothetical protein
VVGVLPATGASRWGLRREGRMALLLLAAPCAPHAQHTGALRLLLLSLAAARQAAVVRLDPTAMRRLGGGGMQPSLSSL